MLEFITHSPDETVNAGREIAKLAKGGTVIALYGEMGAGKTCLATGIASALGFGGEVSSPTFAIVNEYIGGALPVSHFDMYRVKNWDDLYSCGFFDYIDRGFVVITEWSENIEAALDESCIRVKIDKLNENDRRISIKIGGEMF